MPDYHVLHGISKVTLEKLPVPEFSKEITSLIADATKAWLTAHPGAYDGAMFFPLKVMKDSVKQEFTINGHFYEHGYALHSILRDNSEPAAAIRAALEKIGVNYDAGLAVTALLMSEVGVVLFKSKSTAYAQEHVWQIPGGNVQDNEPLDTVLGEVNEEMGIPEEILRKTCQPFLYLWGGANNKSTSYLKGNPTLVYLMSVSSEIIDKYIVPPDDDSEISLDRATKYGIFSVSDIEKIFEGNGEKVTPGVELVLRTLLKTG